MTIELTRAMIEAGEAVVNKWKESESLESRVVRLYTIMRATEISSQRTLTYVRDSESKLEELGAVLSPPLTEVETITMLYQALARFSFNDRIRMLGYVQARFSTKGLNEE